MFWKRFGNDSFHFSSYKEQGNKISCRIQECCYLYNRPLSTGSKNWPQGKQWVLFPLDPEKHWGRGETKLTHCFPRDQPLCVLLYLLTQTRKNCDKIVCFTPTHVINFLRFQRAQPDHVRVESWFCCFPELVSFHPWHVKHFPPIGKRIWVEQYNNTSFPIQECGCHVE